MKKPMFRLGNPDAGLEIELARRRAIHHVHDAAWILTDAMPYADPAYLQSYTWVVDDLSPWNVISPIWSQKHGEVRSPSIDLPESFKQTKPRDAETIASQIPDKRAVQNKCKSYVK
jgi:hypothetical protein